ncbi:MAG TPA: PrsW family intramembrane metalloprotease [Ktedonosporobacter sp.]|nr:PrsW family intramembrane metalloprotease [Ktedonosporobacter sp.]
MSQNVWMPPPQSVQGGGRGWLHVLWIGIVLFIATAIVMSMTGNANLYPTVILIGNFLVPVVFVAFLYDHQHLNTLSVETIGKSFGFGGILGVLGASVLESLLIHTSADGSLTLGSAFLVGLIEEGCKIAAVLFLARGTRHTNQMDGLLLGAAVGMGFAALESTGYAFTAFLSSNGHVSASIFSTVLRGLFAPFGHGVWTGILGAILFRESRPGRFRFNIPVIFTYLFVSLLHGLWDGLPLVVSLAIVVPPGFPISVVTIILSIIGIIVLSTIYRNARQERMYQAPIRI